MHKTICTNLPSLILLLAPVLLSGCAVFTVNPELSCSEGWKVTGYYTPVESRTQNENSIAVKVADHGMFYFDRNFIEQTKIEGWGKTRFGWYLGYYGQQWHRADSSLNSNGKPLKIGHAAIDRNIVPSGSSIHIPSVWQLGFPKYLKAEDQGSAIQSKHIDIYTGEGPGALKLSHRVTAENVEVCVEAG